ncbi:MAG: methyltransferase domain-containing protein, partial [Fibrobacteres bacterium]|nr:methyltransferase domain-containing protein [Fibrobacterota bacterium]
MIDFKSLASQDFIKGEGLEIGALHSPFPVREGVKVKYVDRLNNEELRKHYTELDKYIMTNVDIVDDGETLATIPDNSQDFVIESHFIEHARNPINAIRNALRVLKENGVLLLVIPDKNYTMELLRDSTSFAHLIMDDHSLSEARDMQHYEDFAK